MRDAPSTQPPLLLLLLPLLLVLLPAVPCAAESFSTAGRSFCLWRLQ
jgi:hypothetical protein